MGGCTVRYVVSISDAVAFAQTTREDLLISRRCRSSSLGTTRSLVREPLSLFRRFQNLERAHERLVDAHHGPGVVKLSAVVWRREQGDQLSAGKKLVAVFDHLVGAADKVQVVLVQKLSDDVLPKGERDAPVVFAPSVDLLVGVGPEEIAEKTGVRDIRRPDDALDLVEAGELRAETAVHAQDLFIDDRRRREAVEAVREGLPELDSEATLAFIVEPVNAVDRSTLVVAAEHKKVLGILDLVGQQQADSFETLLSAINVVAEEDVVGLGRETTVLEETQQVVVLPVHIPANLDGSLELEEHGLTDQEIPAAKTKHLDFRFRQVHLLARSSTADTVVGKGR